MLKQKFPHGLFSDFRAAVRTEARPDSNRRHGLGFIIDQQSFTIIDAKYSRLVIAFSHMPNASNKLSRNRFSSSLL